MRVWIFFPRATMCLCELECNATRKFCLFEYFACSLYVVMMLMIMTSLYVIYISKVVATGRQTDSLAGSVNVKQFGAFTHFQKWISKPTCCFSFYQLIPIFCWFLNPSISAPYFINNSYLSIIKSYSNCRIGFSLRYTSLYLF